jgi:hypothetical protein
MAKARRSRRTDPDTTPSTGLAAGTEPPRRAASEVPTVHSGSGLRYEPNSKHKEPWQRGARGSLCPRDVDGSVLLAASELDPNHQGKRYATDGTRAYCGHEHSAECWHGFPVEWRKVPAKIRNAWLADGRIIKRSIREYW